MLYLLSFVLLCVLYKHHLNFKRKREVDLNFADNEIKCLILRDLSARKIILNLKQQKEVIGNKWSYSTSRNYFWINTAFFFVNISFFFEIKYLMISKSGLTWLEITVLWPYPLLFCIISNNFLRFVLLFNLEIVKNYGPKVIINFLYNIKKGEKLLHKFFVEL